MDQLPTQLAELADNQQKVDFLNQTARQILQTSRRNLPRAIALCEMASELAMSGEFQQQPYQTGLVESLTNLGEFYIQFANYDLALSFLFKALDLLEAIDNPQATAAILNWIGQTYGYLGEYDQALDYYLKAQDIYHKQGKRTEQANVLNNVGQVYLHLNELERGLDFFNQSLGLLEEVGAVDELAEVLSNLCQVYTQLGEGQRALDCGLRSAKLYRQRGNTLGQAHVLISLGDLFRMAHRYTRNMPPGFQKGIELLEVHRQTQANAWGIPNNALDCYHTALDQARQVQAKFEMATALLRLGDTYLNDPIPALTENDRMEQAMGYLNMAHSLATEINARPLISESNRLLAVIYKRQGNFQAALEHFEQFHAIREEVFNRETDNRLKNLEIVHQVDAARKEAEISHLKNITLQKEMHDRATAQHELEAANQQLREEISAKELLIADLNAFSYMVAHDLKNPLTNISLSAGLVKLELNRSPTSQGEAAYNEHLERIMWMVSKMNRIINELLTLANVRQEQVFPEPLDMATVVSDVEQRLGQLFQEYQATLVKPAAWPAALGHAPWVEEVWANYLSNAVTYGGRPPYLELGADELEPEGEALNPADPLQEQDLILPAGRVRFWVRDNGDGVPPELQEHLFEPFNYPKIRGAGLQPSPVLGHGLGLSIVKRIVEKMGGSVGMESSGQAKMGSLFYFILPAAPLKTDI